MPRQTFFDIADAWWARDFGLPSQSLRPVRTHVQCHTAELLGDTGIWILVAGGAPMVSLPPDLEPLLYSVADTWSAATVADSNQLMSQLVNNRVEGIERIIGPAFISYAPSLPTSEAINTVRQLNDTDQALLKLLEQACSPEEWEHGGTDDFGCPKFGTFDTEGQLAALASYEVWNANIAHIAIVCHPARRGHGFARCAVHAAAVHALSAGLLPQYRTLRSNVPSMRIAQRLGFIEYGFSVYVRLARASVSE